MRGEGFAGEECRCSRLGRDNLHVGPREPEHLANTGQCAARAPASDEEVEPLAGEVLEDLGAGGVAVISGIRLVLELTRQEPAILLARLAAFFTIPVPRSAAGVRMTLAPSIA